MDRTNKPPTMTPQEQANDRAMIDAFIAQHGVTRLKSAPTPDPKRIGLGGPGTYKPQANLKGRKSF